MRHHTRNKLSARTIETLKSGKKGDGGGLFLAVIRPGYKVWTFRYQINLRQREMGLGPVSDVSLTEAREEAIRLRAMVRAGRDPIDEKNAAAAAKQAQELRTVTFKQAAEQFLATERVEQFKSDVHRKQWRSTLEQYAFPAIGNLPLEAIDSAIILQALLPVFKRVPETGSRVRGRIERVFAWAKAHKLFSGENPASRDVLKDALPAKPKAKHHDAMPYADLPAFLGLLRERESVSARCLEFTILTAARTGEAIGARWSEFDLDARVWTIPASRMKAKKEHRVPLSDRAVEILSKDAPGSNSDFVFINGGGKPLSNMAMLELLRGMAGNGFTVHGFRSAFMDWAHERTGFEKHAIDMALAHVIGDKVEAAYRRGDLFEKRQRLMTEWANYLAHGETGTGNVVAIRA